MSFRLTHVHTFSLRHTGDCSLIGYSPGADRLYLEESYGADGWLAQSAYALDGTLSASVDEDFGRVRTLTPLPVPADLVRPGRVWATMKLNFTGARQRGRRALERIDDLVRPLTLPDKIALVARLGLAILPPQLLGLAESYVLAEAALRPQLFVVCRRLRFAYVFPDTRTDSDGSPYDYDTHVVHTVHLIDLHDDAEPALTDLLAPFGGVTLRRPLDCLLHDHRLIVAEGGDGQQPGCVHIWQVDDLPPVTDPIERLKQRLYE